MVKEYLPDLLEIEYSFKSGGHNSLKFIDWRFFFFSEADSHLTEKNEYLTIVKIPENSALERFWEDLDQLGIWDWEENYSPTDDSTTDDSPTDDYNQTDAPSRDECEHDEHENCNHEHHEEETLKEENLNDNVLEIPADVDIWQVKIIHGTQTISSKSWSSAPESKDDFFNAIKKLVGIDICLPFTVLSQKIAD